MLDKRCYSTHTPSGPTEYKPYHSLDLDVTGLLATSYAYIMIELKTYLGPFAKNLYTVILLPMINNTGFLLSLSLSLFFRSYFYTLKYTY